MEYRRAQLEELAPASKVCAAAFYNDNLFGACIHPHRDSYPDDMHLYWLKRFSIAYGKPDNHFQVCTTSDGRVLGLAHWIRKRDSLLEDQVMMEDEEEGAKSELPLNRAADPLWEDVIERSYEHIRPVWTDKRAECWYLACLAVHPDIHRQGIGRQLVAYGFDQARRDGACVSVIAALGKERFYKRCGFTTDLGPVGRLGGGDNPLRDIPGGVVLFKERESVRHD